VLFKSREQLAPGITVDGIAMDEHERRSPSEYPDRYSSIFDLVAADFSDGICRTFIGIIVGL